MILPKNLQRISLYRAGFPKAETIIIPTKVAPTCGWGDNNELGNRNNVYDYAFSTVTNMASLGTSVPVNKRRREKCLCVIHKLLQGYMYLFQKWYGQHHKDSVSVDGQSR